MLQPFLTACMCAWPRSQLLLTSPWLPVPLQRCVVASGPLSQGNQGLHVCVPLQKQLFFHVSQSSYAYISKLLTMARVMAQQAGGR